jgi:phosphoribosylanthranilate isomerase
MSVKAKICGLSTPESLEKAISSGAAYVGFVHFPPSPRYVSPEQVTDFIQDIPPEIKKVSLTVDADDALLTEIITAYSPDLMQLHGNESPEEVHRIKEFCGLPVMKAVPISSEVDIKIARTYENVADLLLFDAKPPKSLATALPGGNALSFDWGLLEGENWAIPWMLSGGLTTENVVEAINKTHASLVDVSSGVERTRGEKDLDLIGNFLAQVNTV